MFAYSYLCVHFSKSYLANVSKCNFIYPTPLLFSTEQLIYKKKVLIILFNTFFLFFNEADEQLV